MIGLISSNWNEISGIIERYDLLDHVSEQDSNHRRFRAGNNDIVAIQSGVGIKNARISANTMINRYKPDIVINAGIAGALHPELKVGDVIVGDWVYSVKKNKNIQLYRPIDTTIQGINHGGILTNNYFVDLNSSKKCLYEKTGALVVDMEAWGIAEVCQKSGKVFASVKSVSDKSSDSLPRFGYILNEYNRLKYSKAAGYFASNPRLFFKYIEFRFINMKRAVKNLNDFLIKFVNCYNCE